HHQERIQDPEVPAEFRVGQAKADRRGRTGPHPQLAAARIGARYHESVQPERRPQSGYSQEPDPGSDPGRGYPQRPGRSARSSASTWGGNGSEGKPRPSIIDRKGF